MDGVEPMEVSGVIVMQDGSKPEPVTVTLRSGFGREYSAQTADDGSFVIKGVLPELQHFVRINPAKRPDGSLPPAALAPLEQIPVSVLWNGRVLNATGASAAGVQVMLIYIPIKDAQLDFYGPSRALTDGNGEFHTQLRPGTYHVFVTDDLSWDPQGYQYVMTHEKDWGPLQVAAGENPVIRVSLPVNQARKSTGIQFDFNTVSRPNVAY
jgi:hypothetical protein